MIPECGKVQSLVQSASGKGQTYGVNNDAGQDVPY